MIYVIHIICYRRYLTFHLTGSKQMGAASQETNQPGVQLIIGDFLDGQPR